MTAIIAGSMSAAPTHSNRGCPGQRNERWEHMYNANIVSMPDKCRNTPGMRPGTWPFHVVALTMVDEDFGVHATALDLMLANTYVCPSGQLPAYEMELRASSIRRYTRFPPSSPTDSRPLAKRGQGDLDWLERMAATSCSSTSPGGSTSRTSAGQQPHSRADSWASTISA